MSTWYYLNVTVHLLAALLWLGGMFFLAAVGAPVLRRVEPPRLRSRLFRELGARFLKIGWISIGILVVTGIANLHFRRLLSWDVLGDPAFWGSRYGVALSWKLAAVVLMVGIQALHDFVLGPRASRADPRSEQGARARRAAAWLARVNAVVGIVLVLAAVRLARGG